MTYLGIVHFVDANRVSERFSGTEAELRGYMATNSEDLPAFEALSAPAHAFALANGDVHLKCRLCYEWCLDGDLHPRNYRWTTGEIEHVVDVDPYNPPACTSAILARPEQDTWMLV